MQDLKAWMAAKEAIAERLDLRLDHPPVDDAPLPVVEPRVELVEVRLRS
jgi:hypothetical protein